MTRNTSVLAVTPLLVLALRLEGHQPTSHRQSKTPVIIEVVVSWWAENWRWCGRYDRLDL